MSGNPANIGRAPVDVLVLQIEDILRGDVGLHRVAAGGVNQTFRFSCGAGGVEDVERIFRIQRLGRTIGRGIGDQFVPPAVAASYHVHGRAGALVDDDVLDGVASGHGFIDSALELDLSAAAIARVLGDDGDAAASR